MWLGQHPPPPAAAMFFFQEAEYKAADRALVVMFQMMILQKPSASMRSKRVFAARSPCLIGPMPLEPIMARTKCKKRLREISLVRCRVTTPSIQNANENPSCVIPVSEIVSKTDDQRYLCVCLRYSQELTGPFAAVNVRIDLNRRSRKLLAPYHRALSCATIWQHAIAGARVRLVRNLKKSDLGRLSKVALEVLRRCLWEQTAPM